MKTLKNNKGIVLVMVLVLSAITLAVISGLIYMVTSGTKMSGAKKRYTTNLECSLGATDVVYILIGGRGDAEDISLFLNTTMTSYSPAVTTPATCTIDTSVTGCDSFDSYTGLEAKLKTPSYCWTGCDSSLTINTAAGYETTYDMKFELGLDPNKCKVYAKIVDSALEGNTMKDLGLIKGGVVTSEGGEPPIIPVPYSYTVELHAENDVTGEVLERAKISVLYYY